LSSVPFRPLDSEEFTPILWHCEPYHVSECQTANPGRSLRTRANCPPLRFHSSGLQVGLDDHLSNLLIRPPARSDADDMTVGVPRGRGQLRFVVEFLKGLSGGF